MSKEEAAKRIEEIKEPYKLEILNDITNKHPGSPITIYHCGEPGSKHHWWDLCAGPHVESTGDINPAAVDLEAVAGAYQPRLISSIHYFLLWPSERIFITIPSAT